MKFFAYENTERKMSKKKKSVLWLKHFILVKRGLGNPQYPVKSKQSPSNTSGGKEKHF